jgi:hypothetical protein
MPGTRSVAIANGLTTSGALDLADNTLLGIMMPAAFTGTTLTFTASADGVTYAALYDSTGAAVSVTVSTSRYIYIDPVIFAGVRYVKIVSGSAESGARTLALVVRPV